MPKPEGGTLEHVADPRVKVWLVTTVPTQLLAKKGRKVFISNDALQWRKRSKQTLNVLAVKISGALEYGADPRVQIWLVTTEQA